MCLSMLQIQKRCPKCGDLKEISEFYRNKSRPDGIAGHCKVCHRKYLIRGVPRSRIVIALTLATAALFLVMGPFFIPVLFTSPTPIPVQTAIMAQAIISTPVPAPLPTSAPTVSPLPVQYLPPVRIEGVNLSTYYTVLESDYHSTGKSPIKTNRTKFDLTGMRFLTKGRFGSYTLVESAAQLAESVFLYDPGGLCTQGSGKLDNGMYISCTDLPSNIPHVGFEWLFRDDEQAQTEIIALETVAICNKKDKTPFRQGDVLEIPEISPYMRLHGVDEFLTVTDVGSGLCRGGDRKDTLDIYLGLGRATYLEHRFLISISETTVYIYRAPNAPDAWEWMPIVPNVSQRTIEIYQKGRALGRDPHAFSVIGDSNSAPAWFLNGDFSLGADYTYLKDVIDQFQESFGLERITVGRGFTARRILSIGQIPCLNNETWLDCELRIHNPSYAFVALGTNETDIGVFEDNMRKILDVLIARGVVPILATKADNLEGDHSINVIIAHLAYEYDVPLWNFWLAVQPLPGRGLRTSDSPLLTWAENNFSDLKSMSAAWPWRNLTALQTLDAVWRRVTQP